MGDSKKFLEVRSARQTAVRVRLLDDETFADSVDKRAIGWVLFDCVCESLNLIERDYFALSYVDATGVKFWLNNEKKIAKQMKGMNWDFNFEVKFYPPDPAQLHEDLTRYLLCLQIRRDIVNEKLPCSFVTYSLLGSYTAQSELGDYDPEEFGHGSRYLKEIKFAPYQDKELLNKIAELHKHHKGQTPEQSEMNFLENAKKLSMYGVELHPATDAEGTDISLGVCASGMIVYKDKQQINRFVWPKVLKMSYRRNKYYMKIRPGEFEHFASLVGFRLLNVKLSKRLWKVSIEHHSFFRFREPEPAKSLSLFPRFGSRFRYSGRTQFQSRQAVVAEDRPAPAFDRVLSGKRSTFGGRTAKERDHDTRPRPASKAPPPVTSRGPPPVTNKGPPPVTSKGPPPVAPKPRTRGPNSIDSNLTPKGSLEDLDRSYEDEREKDRLHERKSKIDDKLHNVQSPLAAIMVNSRKSNANEVDSNSNSQGPPGYTTDDPEHRVRLESPALEERMERREERPRERAREHRRERSPPRREVHEEVLVETIGQGVASPPPQPPAPLSLKERKAMEKESKERRKREKEDLKRKKKEEELEIKRLAKEKKDLLAQEKKAAKKTKKGGAPPVMIEETLQRRDSRDSKEAARDIGRDWEEARTQEERDVATPERTRKRLSSFEEINKSGRGEDEDMPPALPKSLPPGKHGSDEDSDGGSASASGSGSSYTSDEDEEEDHGKDAEKKKAGRRGSDAGTDEEVSF